MTEQQNNMVAPILATIANADIREFAKTLIEGLPSYIWEVVNVQPLYFFPPNGCCDSGFYIKIF